MTRLLDDLVKRKKLRAGMVGGGAGAFFASIHRAAMRLSNRFELVAGAFSSNPERCREAGDALDISSDRVYASFQEMAEKEAARSDRIDAAIVVTPNHLHFKPCRLFLEAGIPVICDKPLVNSSWEARELQRIAEETGVFLGVTYTYTGYPMVRDARARISRGELGDIKFMHVEYLLEWLADPNAHIGAGRAWRGDPAKAGPTGALGDIGTHAFNILEFVSGLRCTALSAKLTSRIAGWELDDTDVLQLEFGDKVDGLLWSSLASPGHRNGLRFKIVGSLGTMEWRQEAPETLHVSRLAHSDLIYRRGQKDMTLEGLASVSLPAGNPEAYLEALAVLYTDYAQAIEAGADWKNAALAPIAGIEEGLRGVLLSEVSVESNARRCWLPFPTS
ncbi:Gfo/Idh/MocA family oxidoreductase [Rhizobium sp. BK060]|uniref:Gfo/Idh/MocA family protein n=1 Tax=Rhizobium sp. BK060 TaxID=2587096 RepID=UPI0016170F01|nr:Gfo/Idh/MocA family oxidoreductase [Rhizobium sp. BK060]MBB3396037.1 putative dehydrogenase [Rhizobium sp. BK060]